MQVELGQYSPHFCEQSVSGEILPEIQRDDLKELGMKKLGHRLRFLRALEKLLAQHETLSDLTEETDLSSIDSSLSIGCLQPELLIDCKLPERHSRLIRVPRNASLQELIHRVELKLGDLFYPVNLKYKDSDGELVWLLSEADYFEALTLFSEPGLLRLYAFPSPTQQQNNSSTRSSQSNDKTSGTKERTRRNHAPCMTQRHRPKLSYSSASKQQHERIAADGDDDEMSSRERMASNDEETGGIRATFIATKVVMDKKTKTEGGSSKRRRKRQRGRQRSR
ncbi:SAM domain (Sterile alpha motif) domain containing protein [Balamuthia mandrillaris]